MMQIRKFTVITPCFNAEKYIEETIQSVVQQTVVISKRAELEYIICDGGSTDRTLEIAARYQVEFGLKIISEKDNGMYDALAKGLALATGEVCSYLNAGDYYSKSAFDVVMDIMQENDVSWLTGINTHYNERSQIISFLTPFRYRSSFLRAGFYGTILPFIQQESTFWSRELHKLVDMGRLQNFKLAGDSYLWHCFSSANNLFIVRSYLGGFKVHEGQLSGNLKAYRAEMRDIVKPNWLLKPLAYLELLIWYFPDGLKKRLNRKQFFNYDFLLGRWK